MKCQYLQDKIKIIEETLNKAKISANDPQLASMLSGYIVVFICGIYEDCVEYLFIQRAGKNNDEELKNLVKELIHRQFRNPSYDNIKKMIKWLDPSYIQKLDSNVNHRSIIAIDSIVTNKNNIAHGKVSSATLKDISDYHYNAMKIFELLEDILL